MLKANRGERNRGGKGVKEREKDGERVSEGGRE